MTAVVIPFVPARDRVPVARRNEDPEARWSRLRIVAYRTMAGAHGAAVRLSRHSTEREIKAAEDGIQAAWDALEDYRDSIRPRFGAEHYGAEREHAVCDRWGGYLFAAEDHIRTNSRPAPVTRLPRRRRTAKRRTS